MFNIKKKKRKKEKKKKISVLLVSCNFFFFFFFLNFKERDTSGTQVEKCLRHVPCLTWVHDIPNKMFMPFRRKLSTRGSLNNWCNMWCF